MTQFRDPAVLISGDPDLVQVVQAAAAARGSPVRAVADPAAIRARWRDAGAVIVGADLAETVANLNVPPRGEVYLIGPPGAEAGLVPWSMPLHAAVLPLPAGARWLAQILSGPSAAHGLVVAVAGGTGGIGATTLAAGLALAARRRGPAALVDLDARGGGIDLVLGAESTPGWRWDTLRSASGHVADLAGQLPAADGVTIVAASRSDRRDPPAEAVGAVVDGLARDGGTVVVDLGGGPGAGGVGGGPSAARDEAVRAASRVVVLTGQSVRAVAATAAVLGDLADRRADLVVRRERGGAIAPAAVAEALGVPLLGVLPSVGSLPVLADRGVPPGRSAGWRWARACRRLADDLAATQPTPRRQGRS
ncbi:MAG: hypothetical protein LBR33_09180 [Propionibacteriaceae bacterium]|nr:hypothetical protein [Propionibacteriaceae bacterium]